MGPLYPYRYPLRVEPAPKSRGFTNKGTFISKNAYLLIPGLLETGIAYLISFSLNDPANTAPGGCPIEKSDQDSLGFDRQFPFKLLILASTIFSVGGIAGFIYFSISQSPKTHPLHALLPIGIGLNAVILLFASVDLMMYVLFPTSFKGEIGGDIVERALNFLYYSALGISVGPAGDILPTEITTRLLLGFEGLVNLSIFSLLIAVVFFK